VRFVAATNKSLAQLVDEGKFREDLYYRINTFVLRLPPLRHRKDDIPHLASQLLQQLSREIRRPATLDPDAEQALVEHTWPGNVRELRNVLERAMLVCASAVIRRADLRLGPSGGRPATVQATASGTLEEVEWQHIQRVLKEEGGSVGRAARRLGIPRSTLYQRLKVQDARRPSPEA
jgi:transcriptional regulator with PAS, ATPase and Fis domain